MVRSLVSALFRPAHRPRARVTSPAAPRFVPTVQPLEVREVPAVLGLFTPAFESLPASGDSLTSPTAVSREAKGDYLRIDLSDVLISNYTVSSHG